MAIKKTSKPNTTGPNSTWKYGELQDKVINVQPGTPLNRYTHEDYHEFFERLMDIAGIQHNDFQDNDANGYQLFEALNLIPRSRDIKMHGRESKLIQTLGSGTLVKPMDCAVDPKTELLYVAEDDTGNQRVFVWDINTGTRKNSLEWSLGRPCKSISAYNGYVYYTIQNAGNLYFIVREVQTGNSASLTLFSRISYLTPDHEPRITIDPRRGRAYMTKGNTNDSNVSSGFKVVDIQNPLSPSEITAEALIFSNSIFTAIEMIQGGDENAKVAVANYDTSAAWVVECPSGEAPGLEGSVSFTIHSEPMSFIHLGQILYVRGPTAYVPMDLIREQDDVGVLRNVTIPATSTDYVGGVDAYHSASVDDNGYFNNKLFECNPNGEVNVWLRELPDQSLV